MIRECPRCQDRLTEFSLTCEKCGWSIVESEAGNGQKTSPGADDFVPLTGSSSAADSTPESDLAMPSANEMGPMGIDMRIENAMDFISQEDYATALSFLNRAIVDAPGERLSECFSLRGYVYLKKLDFPKAEADCSAAISHDWDEAQTYAWRAAARGEQNKWKLAFDDLDRACELAGPHRDQYLSLMESYAANASDYFRELIKAGSDSADMFFERGWIYFRSGKYEKAERDFNHALGQHPNHPWASIGLAELRLHDGQTGNIMELCEAAIAGDADCQRRALRIRIELNRVRGDIGSAKLDLDRLAELANNDPQEVVECCRMRSQLGDNVIAIEELTAVLEHAPGHDIAILVRGDCYREIRNYGHAIIDYSSYLKRYPRDISALIRRAKAYLATKRYLAAHADLDRVMEIDDTDFGAYLLRSKIYLEQGRLDAALTECRRAVRLDNQQAEAFAVLAAIYNQLCDYGNAIEEYCRSIELADDSDEKAQYLYLRGISYYELGDFDKSLADFKKACRLRPNHAGSWIWKAAASARMEDWANAILGLQQAILVRPSASEQYQILGRPVAEKSIAFFDRQQQRGHSKTDLFVRRGLAYQFLGKSEQAIKDFTTALEREPEDTEILLRRGQVYTRNGDHKLAINDFTRVIKQDKQNHAARYCRAISHLTQGNFEQVKKDLLKAIRLAPGHPRYHILLGELLQKTGDGYGSIESFDRALMQDPTNPATYRRRGAAHLALGQYLHAVSDFTRSLELYPGQLEVLVQRGQTYLKAGHPLMAIEDFELALTHNDRLAKAYSGRAAALVTQGRHEYTLIWLTKAIHRFTDPRELSEIVFARGKVYYQMGRIGPAISDFSTVIELMRGDKKTMAAARYARAIAEIHNQQFEAAERDFRKLKAVDPMNERFAIALRWLADRNQLRPRFLNPPDSAQRPTRPPIIRNGVKLSADTTSKWESEPPYDSWVVRTADKKEYGPIHFGILNTWVNEGRVNVGMRLLRSDWSKWKRVERILPEITPLESGAGLVEEFPKIDLNLRRLRKSLPDNDA